MSMNAPQPQDNINVQPTPQDAAPAPQVDATPAAPVEQTAPADTTQAQVEQAPTAEQEQQVIDGVAQGLADDEITAEDIMTAVLSDSLGLSPNGARSLFQLLMQDLADDATEEADMIEQPPME